VGRTRPIETSLLSNYLKDCGHSQTIINKTLFAVDKIVGNQTDGLYDINKAFYSVLRYGVKVKEEAGENTQTIKLIE